MMNHDKKSRRIADSRLGVAYGRQAIDAQQKNSSGRFDGLAIGRWLGMELLFEREKFAGIRDGECIEFVGKTRVFVARNGVAKGERGCSAAITIDGSLYM